MFSGLRPTLAIVILMVSTGIFSQVTNTATLDTSSGERLGNTSIGAYMDLYYGYSFNKPVNHRVPYISCMNRHNEFNVNLAFIDLRYQSEKVRARLVPGFGTYMNENYDAEPGSLRNIVEASAGIRLNEKRRIWLDAGVLGSPYTNESAISKDHLMYTRSLSSEYTPFYLSGLKLSVPLNAKTNFAFYLVNGWQQITDQNNGKSVGTQFEFKLNKNNLLNWNTYIGDERSALTPWNRVRYFSDIYWLFDAGKKWSFSSCIYAGIQMKKDYQGNTYSPRWWQANFISSYRLSERLSIAGRVEYFSDPDKTILPAMGAEGFTGGSASINCSYKLSEKALVRFEGRHFLSRTPQFTDSNSSLSNHLTWLIVNLTVWL